MKIREEKYKILNEKVLLKWKFFNVVKSKIRLPDGKITEWGCITGPDIVAGVVLTKDKKIR